MTLSTRTAEKSLQFSPVTFPIANILTVARIIMIPLVVVLFYMPQSWAMAATGWVFILAAVTDSLDGYLARKLGQTSALGAFLDPVADKLMVAVALILLVSYDPPMLEFIKFDPHTIIALTATVIVGREITISALREWMAEVGARAKVAVSNIGKLKTIFQMTGLSMMLFRDDVWFIPAFELGFYCLVAAAALTLWSMVVYLRAAWPDLMRSSTR
ncbi:CDP-diacylglycerol--glycerol-3-phosphate 3-phosphatidyltransferase [Steroidobacter sp. S1-65]|uniref:CDP-diacylglycerol--glycerol-3-phosphate 3-phosphatidyltransferase n=1 Tax=Steroidobacter gossypii TaxID=2805490 RepID=A0ABS1WXH5_9GAMM|nr:CDP-diacylglycerol--glycerol-3-phosphate 3-phosphatidyltransferase [Steroidobacter gossypii]MBM0105679.1 CDP-diacylglycerol--glycerol-3-phosphate 3-phosphatidyltransferase [Steroidobacter gossypii]